MDKILDMSSLVDSSGLGEKLLGGLEVISEISPVVSSPEVSKLSGVEDLFREISQSPSRKKKPEAETKTGEED